MMRVCPALACVWACFKQFEISHASKKKNLNSFDVKQLYYDIFNPRLRYTCFSYPSSSSSSSSTFSPLSVTI